MILINDMKSQPVSLINNVKDDLHKDYEEDDYEKEERIN